MWKANILIGVLLVLACDGCSKPVQVEIFYTDKSGSAVRCSSVEVRLVRATEAEDHLRASDAKAIQLRKRLELDRESIRSRRDNLRNQGRMDEWWKLYESEETLSKRIWETGKAAVAFESGWPGVVTKVETDADGKALVPYQRKPDDFWVVAMVQTEKVKRYWALPFSPDEHNRMILNDRNTEPF
jgi:hypothetical protein